MLLVTNLTDSPKQQTTVLLEDNTSVVLSLYFHPATQRWVFDVEYDAFSSKGLNLCLHPNILRSYRRVLPFGLAVVAADGADPFDINDFVNGRVLLYVLDNTGASTDVESVETTYFGGQP